MRDRNRFVLFSSYVVVIVAAIVYVVMGVDLAITFNAEWDYLDGRRIEDTDAERAIRHYKLSRPIGSVLPSRTLTYAMIYSGPSNVEIRLNDTQMALALLITAILDVVLLTIMTWPTVLLMRRVSRWTETTLHRPVKVGLMITSIPLTAVTLVVTLIVWRNLYGFGIGVPFRWWFPPLN